jgi:hypothetical protein
MTADVKYRNETRVPPFTVSVTIEALMTDGTAALAALQHSSPLGGLVTTGQLDRHDLEPGHVMRSNGEWVAVTVVVDDGVHGVTSVAVFGTASAPRWLTLTGGDSPEVRRDFRIHPETLYRILPLPATLPDPERLAREVAGAYKELDGFELVQSTDDVERDLEVTHTAGCGRQLFDAEPGDSLATLARGAATHQCASNEERLV